MAMNYSNLTLLIFAIICGIAIVDAHNYLTNPLSRGQQAYTQTGCRFGGEGSPTCAGPCDRKVSQINQAPIVVNRGDTIQVNWYRHNHPGGFIRFAWSPTSQSDSHSSFDSRVDHIVCKEVGGCGPANSASPAGEPNGVDCGTTVTVPTYLTNGLWTLQWAYFGGWFNAGDYFACVDYQIVGGPTGTQQPAYYQGGDYTNPNKNVCLFYSTNALHVCTEEPCLNGTFPQGAQTGPAFGFDSTPGQSTTGVQTTGVQTTGVQTTGVQTTGVQTTGVQTTGVQTTGVQTTAPRTTGVQTTGVQTTGVQTTAPRTTGVQTTGIQTTAVQTTSPRTTGVQTTGEQTSSPRTTGVQTTGVQTSSPRTTGVQTTGVQTSSPRTTGVQTTGVLQPSTTGSIVNPTGNCAGVSILSASQAVMTFVDAWGSGSTGAFRAVIEIHVQETSLSNWYLSVYLPGSSVVTSAVNSGKLLCTSNGLSVIQAVSWANYASSGQTMTVEIFGTNPSGLNQNSIIAGTTLQVLKK